MDFLGHPILRISTDSLTTLEGVYMQPAFNIDISNHKQQVPRDPAWLYSFPRLGRLLVIICAFLYCLTRIDDLRISIPSYYVLVMFGIAALPTLTVRLAKVFNKKRTTAIHAPIAASGFLRGSELEIEGVLKKMRLNNHSKSIYRSSLTGVQQWVLAVMIVGSLGLYLLIDMITPENVMLIIVK